MLKAALALLPALVFLGALVLMDSFKLVPLRAVLRTIAIGGLAAVVCTFANGFLFDASGMELSVFSRYVAPVVEELAKAAWIAVLIRRQWVGLHVLAEADSGAE